jgi:beta-RFAP synthase
MMIQEPGVQVRVELATAWKAAGPRADRALAFAQRFLATIPQPPFSDLAVHVEQCAPEHAGLGTGTQLALAVARAVVEALHLPPMSSVELAERLGRGVRSGIGVHGFQHGGFLIEGGKGERDDIAPLLARHDVPAEWQVLLIVPRHLQGLHGERELAAFAELSRAPGQQATTDALCRLVLLGMLPALVERDLSAFGESLYEFNRRVGERFAPVQGGIYAHPWVESMVHELRQEGVKGVGQSSWGPAVFAVDEGERLGPLRNQLLERHGLGKGECLIARAANRGAEVS